MTGDEILMVWRSEAMRSHQPGDLTVAAIADLRIDTEDDHD